MYKFLDGVRILELGHILMAPYATQFMGDMGADVIKVESLDGDYYRSLGLSKDPGMSAQWMAVNRNKRSIALDLKSEEGRETLKDLIRQSDLLVHNMRAQAIERLGFGYEAVRDINPGIVYCAAIGFGQDGPYAEFPAFDDVIQAWSGLADVNGRLRGRPTFVPVAIADKVVGLMLGQAMLAGLHRQQSTGEGSYIETPMFEAMVSVVLNQHLNGHTFQPPIDDLGYKRVMSPHRHPSPTKDGFLVHGVYKFEHWQKFLEAVDRHDILNGPLMESRAAMASGITELYALAANEIMPTRTTAEWQGLLEELDIPSAPVKTLEDLEEDPHLQAVGLFEDYEHPTRGPMRQVRSPVTARDVEQGPDRYPPELGQHGAEILSEFGYSEERISDLENRGIVGRFSA
ncbi:CaiB/BaiF CoA transferase family protein [Sneathiella chinensis]|uniref:CoA transferase n=1 Tax=Sneathiella chinensis TaxID=349750 RepID=A0ABQ5TZX6_9PROT|nr:CoA transferase [Sneathiella chinensis]GLQ05123.1 CoA transferase [Sneathiella chinensis]